VPRPAVSFVVLSLLVIAPGCPRPSTGAGEPENGAAIQTEAKSPVKDPSGGRAISEVTPELAPTADPATGVVTLSADREASKIGFVVARATVGHFGHFERFTATLELTEGQPTGLEISVRTGSVVTDARGLTSHLESADFFDVDKFPTATFTADTIETLAEEDEATHRIRGTMRLHGVERKLDFPATLELGAKAVVGRATLDISAKAFAIDYQGMEEELAEDEVQLEIELTFPRVAATD
jgi:polyisoprenoid-binding protein YceI